MAAKGNFRAVKTWFLLIKDALSCGGRAVLWEGAWRAGRAPLSASHEGMVVLVPLVIRGPL